MSKDKIINYNHLSQELDQILESIQSNQIDIDQAIKFYKRGQEIITQLQTYLKSAENKVTKLTKDFS